MKSVEYISELSILYLKNYPLGSFTYNVKCVLGKFRDILIPFEVQKPAKHEPPS